jgi:hypothetical protein
MATVTRNMLCETKIRELDIILAPKPGVGVPGTTTTSGLSLSRIAKSCCIMFWTNGAMSSDLGTGRDGSTKSFEPCTAVNKAFTQSDVKLSLC